MMRALASAVAAAFCLAAAGCSQVVENYNDSRNFYSPEYASYVASRGPIPTVVHNAPFGDVAVAQRVPAPGFIANAKFVAARGPEWLAYDRVVMAFNPEPGTDSQQLCRVTDVPGTPSTGARRFYVLAVLCRGTYPTSNAALSAPVTQSPDDPNFRNLMSQLSLALFPSRRYDGDGCNRSGC